MNTAVTNNNTNDTSTEKMPLFFNYVYMFVYIGFKLLFKEGSNAFNPNTMIENVNTSSGVVPISKAKAKVEKLKETRRNSPKYLKMKQKLADDMAAEAGQKLEEPVVFKYTVMNDKGKIIVGRFTGSSIADINAFLVNEGYEVFGIETNDMINFVYGQSKLLSVRMNNKDLIFWLTQLSTYIKAGIPLVDAVRILSGQMGKDKDSSKTQIFNAVVYELSMGTAFSDALAKQGNVFPQLLINMLKAAEATGNLEETLDEMAEYYTEVNETAQQMKSAMTYPILVLVFAFCILTFILIFIVPKFVGIYDSAGITLSPMTTFLIDLSAFLKNYLIVLIGVIILIIVTIIVIYKNVQAVRREMQVLAMHTPVFGNIIIYKEITIFTKTFASLLRNNVFITECIDILSKITANEIYKEVMYATMSNIARGEKISDSFADQWCIPEIAYFMIRTGESTGDLANMMQKVSEYYSTLHKSMINSMKSLIEPVMIVTVAVLVGLILVAVIMPMFEMYEQMSF